MSEPFFKQPGIRVSEVTKPEKLKPEDISRYGLHIKHWIDFPANGTVKKHIADYIPPRTSFSTVSQSGIKDVHFCSTTTSIVVGNS